jgi:hypothetical protein
VQSQGRYRKYRWVAVLCAYCVAAFLVSWMLARFFSPGSVAGSALRDLRRNPGGQISESVGGVAGRRGGGGSVSIYAGLIFAVIMGLSLVGSIVCASFIRWWRRHPVYGRWFPRGSSPRGP